jgi:hypothetical protein
VKKSEFLTLMQYPSEWLEWDMYPDELFNLQVSNFQPGHEQGAEHDRNGAFHWWIRKEPSAEELRKLIQLTHLDPDRPMATDVRTRLRKLPNYEPSMDSTRNQE